LITARPISNLKNHPLSAVHGYLFNKFTSIGRLLHHEPQNVACRGTCPRKRLLIRNEPYNKLDSNTYQLRHTATVLLLHTVQGYRKMQPISAFITDFQPSRTKWTGHIQSM